MKRYPHSDSSARVLNPVMAAQVFGQPNNTVKATAPKKVQSTEDLHQLNEAQLQQVFNTGTAEMPGGKGMSLMTPHVKILSQEGNREGEIIGQNPSASSSGCPFTLRGSHPSNALAQRRCPFSSAITPHFLVSASCSSCRMRSCPYPLCAYCVFPTPQKSKG